MAWLQVCGYVEKMLKREPFHEVRKTSKEAPTTREESIWPVGLQE